MNRYTCFISLVIFLLLSPGCRKDEPVSMTPGDKGSLSITISHIVDNVPFETDTVLYKTPSGLKYSISTLRYYVSMICLTQEDGKKYTSDTVFYIDADQPGNILHLTNVPTGNYTQLSFFIGLDETHNKPGSLPLILENMNMAWPDEMGGGYHFLKLEGYYLNTQNQSTGYAIHLGTNGMYVKHNSLQCTIPVSKEKETSINLEMNINEWFSNPYAYDFINDGNYTMADSKLMKLIRDNGKDVFKLR